jgi:glycerol-3-phosphate dehydrogenase (NAD(P)+)
MPITEGVHQVCHDGLSVSELGAALLGRDRKHERQ